ncbi:MAG: hypothetical protein LBC82_01800 [Oscillospiraceae bacterium]|jgi:transglutaminase/protease-like cytokinesis protein 3|nr:hypothetical protein [Oscillospiraceae bacterium]
MNTFNNYWYYYHKLSIANRHVYNQILAGIRECKNKIKVSSYPNNETVFKITQYVLLDNPQLFFIDSSKTEILQFGKNKEVCLNYLYSPLVSKEMQLRIDIKVKEMLSSIVKINVADSEKEKHIYTKLIQAVKYNNRNLSNQNANNNIVGPLLNRLAVCEGYAKAFKYLCNSVNIPCVVVCGSAKTPPFDNSENHAWNIVKIDDAFYHVDSTWDSILDESDFFDYFNLSDREICNDHEWDVELLPACDKEFHTKQIIRTAKELDVFVATQISHGLSKFAIWFDMRIANETEILNKISNAINVAPHHFQNKVSTIQLRYNKAQNKAVVNIN